MEKTKYRCHVCNKFIFEDDGITTFEGLWVCDKDSCRALDENSEAYALRSLMTWNEWQKIYGKFLKGKINLYSLADIMSQNKLKKLDPLWEVNKVLMYSDHKKQMKMLWDSFFKRIRVFQIYKCDVYLSNIFIDDGFSGYAEKKELIKEIRFDLALGKNALQKRIEKITKELPYRGFTETYCQYHFYVTDNHYYFITEA